MSIWRCNSCGVHRQTGELLRAPSPFDPQDELIGCPHCKRTDGFDEICDEPGCEARATCGWKPKGEAYRRTCGKHMGEHHHEP